jgi:hypothetical protein
MKTINVTEDGGVTSYTSEQLETRIKEIEFDIKSKKYPGRCSWNEADVDRAYQDISNVNIFLSSSRSSKQILHFMEMLETDGKYDGLFYLMESIEKQGYDMKKGTPEILQKLPEIKNAILDKLGIPKLEVKLKMYRKALGEA